MNIEFYLKKFQKINKLENKKLNIKMKSILSNFYFKKQIKMMEKQSQNKKYMNIFLNKKMPSYFSIYA